jgi:hypothetical protein
VPHRDHPIGVDVGEQQRRQSAVHAAEHDVLEQGGDIDQGLRHGLKHESPHRLVAVHPLAQGGRRKQHHLRCDLCLRRGDGRPAKEDGEHADQARLQAAADVVQGDFASAAPDPEDADAAGA